MSSIQNLREEAAGLSEYWSPKILGQVNDQYLKVAKLKGELVWHKHELEDELFLVLQGHLRIEYKDRFVDLHEGDFHIVPKATMHNPCCKDECLIALFESVTTQHTGDAVIGKTKSIETQLTT